MGLDITAYGRLQPATETAAGAVLLRPSLHFPARFEGLQEGYYTALDMFDFGAGDYARYNAWRDQLAKLAGYRAAPQQSYPFDYASSVWQASGGRFWELINFADTEGVIGPVVAAKLLQDFQVFWPLAAEQPREFYALYRCFAEAFKIASDRGAVRFH